VAISAWLTSCPEAGYVNHNGLITDLVVGPESMKISATFHRLVIPDLCVVVDVTEIRLPRHDELLHRLQPPAPLQSRGLDGWHNVRTPVAEGDGTVATILARTQV
jgi:hypothetical protein